MRIRPSRIHLIAGIGVALLIGAVVLGLDRFDTHVQVAYPLSTWRMDLDDALIGVGTVLVGVAAIWTVHLKQRATDARVTKLADKLNGGMSELARQHMQEDEMIVGILHRMDRFEDERDDCIEERRELHERLINCLGGPPT